MPAFNPEDPYPLLPVGSFSHAEACLHAEEVDRWLGIRTHETEAGIERLHQAEGIRASEGQPQQAWVGLAVQSLQTPYLEIRRMLDDLALAPATTVIDLGAAYGRMAWVMAKHHGDAKFVGYELVAERVEESRRCLSHCGISADRIQQADLASLSFQLPEADAYFIYDFGSRHAITRVLEEIRSQSQRRSVSVIGRGRATRDLIERRLPWLSQVIPPLHRGNYSIYRTA